MAAILGLAADGPIALQVPELFDRSVAGTEHPPIRSADEDAVYTAALDAAIELRALLEAHTCCPEGMTESVTSKLIAAGPDLGGGVVEHLLALLIAARETTASWLAGCWSSAH
ncbi:hypothetical protein [Nocardia abscessus]|uniref:hypothetical protein n=1 Tax=Nocardia abscessus TaxID=120957 RepID=UPI0002EBDB01|nr:hypothetical protein [Nocardia abscessus]MCC3332911.1 hypothetical protein [Nocardia abscessus]